MAIDSLDWMEQLIWFDIEQRYSEKETAYGKGSMIAVDNYWRPVLDRLNILRNQRSMAVILLAHCEVKKFDSPEVDSYERYQIKLQARASAVVQEWSDVVGFANSDPRPEGRKKDRFRQGRQDPRHNDRRAPSLPGREAGLRGKESLRAPRAASPPGRRSVMH